MDSGAGYLRRNALLGAIASLSSAAALFAIFRLSVETVGVDWLAVWSLMQGLMLLARIADSGAGSNLIREVAERTKAGRSNTLPPLVVAGTLITAVPASLLSVFLAPLVAIYVAWQFGSELEVAEIWSLAAICLSNAVLSSFATVVSAVLEGRFLIRTKNILVISSNVVGLLVVWPLLAVGGSAGIGWTYVAITLTQLIGGALVLVRALVATPRLSTVSWAAVSKEISTLWRENLQLTGVALARLSFEPATKLALSFVAPLAVIASFELALRITTQVRVTVQAALQPLLAIAARRDPKSAVPRSVLGTFARVNRSVGLLTLGLALAQICAAPLISWAGLATPADTTFTLFVAILAASNAVNTAGLAGYTFQLASGGMGRLLRLQVAMAIVNGAVASIAVLTADSYLVVVAGYGSAFVLGGIVSRLFLPVDLRWREASIIWVGPFLVAGSIQALWLQLSAAIDAPAVLFTSLCLSSVSGALLLAGLLKLRRSKE